MAWHRPGDKPFSEAMLIRFPTHIIYVSLSLNELMVIGKEEKYKFFSKMGWGGCGWYPRLLRSQPDIVDVGNALLLIKC